MMEAHRNASTTNDQGKREGEVARIASLKLQIQDLNRNIELMIQQNQELSRRLMEYMKHQHSSDKETQEAVHPKPEIEQGHKREKQGDSHGPRASASQQTNDLGGGATAKQKKWIQKMQDQLDVVMEALRGKTPSMVEALV